MSAGFQVVDEYGVTVVDENNVCLAFREKGTRTANNAAPFWVPSSSVYYDDVTYTGGDAPVFAIHKPFVNNGRNDHGAGLWGVGYNSSTNTWTFRTIVTANPNWGPVDYSYTYYIFDRPKVTATNGAGIEIFDANGGIVFSSHFQQLKMKPEGTTLPAGTYAHTYAANVTLINDTRDEMDSFGNIRYWFVYTANVSTFACTTTGIVSAGISSSNEGSDTWQPSGIESNANGGSLIVDAGDL
jgi:hypothetical protein